LGGGAISTPPDSRLFSEAMGVAGARGSQALPWSDSEIGSNRQVARESGAVAAQGGRVEPGLQQTV